MTGWLCLGNSDALLFQHCTYSQGRSFPKNKWAQALPTPHAFWEHLCSAGSSNLWEHISYFHMQKAVDTTGNETWYQIPKNLLGGTVPSHQYQLLRLWLMKRAQWSCVGAKEHDSTRADICSLRWDPNKEDLPSPPTFQQLRCLQGRCWMKKTLG